MCFFSRRKTLGVLLGLALMSQAVVPGVSYAAYAVRDDRVGSNTESIKESTNDIKQKTEQIQTSTDNIDKNTQKILEYLARVWRQGEQESRSFDEVEHDEGGGFSGNLAQDKFAAIIEGLAGGKNISYDDVLGTLIDKDSELYSVLGTAFQGMDSGNWSGFRNVVKNKLVGEFQKLKNQTKHSDVFPELSDSDIQDILNSGDSGKEKLDAWWEEKFPVLPDEIKAERTDISKIRASSRQVNGQIMDNLAKTHKQSASARLAIMKELSDSSNRLQALLQLIPKVEGTKQAQQLGLQIEMEKAIMQGLKLQLDANHYQETSVALQAQERINQNIEDATAAEVATGTALTENVTNPQDSLAEQFPSSGSVVTSSDSN